MSLSDTRTDIRVCPFCGGEAERVRYVEPPFRVVQCGACGLVYLGNPPEEHELYEAYYSGADLEPGDYREDSADARLNELYQLNEQRLDRIVRLQPAGRLLDVGCGRGFFLASARRRGYEVQGIDISEQALRYARQSFDLDVETSGLGELLDRGERYDVITLWHVVEHFLDPVQTLQQTRMLLAEGGVAVIEVPNLSSLKFRLSRRKWQGGNHPLYHRTFFTAATLSRALDHAGFRRARRLRLSYRTPGRSAVYHAVKQLLNVAAMDAFLDFAAWR